MGVKKYVQEVGLVFRIAPGDHTLYNFFYFSWGAYAVDLDNLPGPYYGTPMGKKCPRVGRFEPTTKQLLQSVVSVSPPRPSMDIGDIKIAIQEGAIGYCEQRGDDCTKRGLFQTPTVTLKAISSTNGCWYEPPSGGRHIMYVGFIQGGVISFPIIGDDDDSLAYSISHVVGGRAYGVELLRKNLARSGAPIPVS